MREIRCPPLSDALIAYLEATFPDQAADPAKVDPSVAFGNAQVVRHLKAVKEQQEESDDVSA